MYDLGTEVYCKIAFGNFKEGRFYRINGLGYHDGSEAYSLVIRDDLFHNDLVDKKPGRVSNCIVIVEKDIMKSNFLSSDEAYILYQRDEKIKFILEQ